MGLAFLLEEGRLLLCSIYLLKSTQEALRYVGPRSVGNKPPYRPILGLGAEKY